MAKVSEDVGAQVMVRLKYLQMKKANAKAQCWKSFVFFPALIGKLRGPIRLHAPCLRA